MDISAELAETQSYGGFFAITVGGDADGWLPARQCYDDGSVDLIEKTAAGYGTTELRIAASMIQFSHASRLWSPVLACVAGAAVAPDLAGLQRFHSGTALRLPVANGRSVGDGEALAELLYGMVVEEHLDRLAAGLRVKIAPGLLYGNAAAALVGAARALVGVRPDLRQPVSALTRALLNIGGLAGTMTGPRPRRRSCCLFYRVPGGSYCGDCALGQ
ncbi:(2Fe-2S)-binding protein [Mycobacterium aquaticum]|uniref:Iron reductase n=1 Tax=Mycobacterium aquaticum TaxID=1927124 RepID=A0A1X0AT90_9MYCO|nr:(2Fe-2S)-binding protein [Mycobacterium aquaticum]ORA33271.1 iron reductase [Mycobacterium aquaticum]